jgi:NTP pyrophosphatase (non-canonical NTP hydrolase)
VFPNEMKTLHDFQSFHRWLDEHKGFSDDLYHAMILFTGEVGEVAQVLKQIRWKASLLKGEHGAEVAHAEALAAYRDDLGHELADCLAYVFKMANYAGIDLEQAYLNKMARNAERTWTGPKAPEGQ